MEASDLLTATIGDLNRRAVNVQARAMLLEAGETPDDSCLHMVQLALWGIEKGGLETEPEVLETVRAMTSWTPARHLNFFCDRTSETIPDIAGWEGASTPLDLAKAILTAIDSRTFTVFPCYRSGE